VSAHITCQDVLDALYELIDCEECARRSGLYDARILVHGHWHNFAVSQAGDARWIISCPSADRGSDWWTNLSGDSTRPAILTFEAAGGNASAWELYS